MKYDGYHRKMMFKVICIGNKLLKHWNPSKSEEEDADEYVEKRIELNGQFEKELGQLGSTEIVEDIVADVKTPPGGNATGVD